MSKLNSEQGISKPNIPLQASRLEGLMLALFQIYLPPYRFKPPGLKITDTTDVLDLLLLSFCSGEDA